MINAEKNLWVNVILRMLRDTHAAEHQHRRDAFSWALSPHERDQFIEVCDLADIEPHSVIRVFEILSTLSVPERRIYVRDTVRDVREQARRTQRCRG